MQLVRVAVPSAFFASRKQLGNLKWKYTPCCQTWHVVCHWKEKQTDSEYVTTHV